MHIQPYLCFEGRCEEAIEFYKQALGAEVLGLRRFSEAPPSACAEGQKTDLNKVMHAAIKIGSSEILMSDGMNSGKSEFKGVSLSITADSDEQARTRFQSLCDGGQVKVELNKTFFASSFGMCTDKFGVDWLVMVPSAVPAAK